MLFVALTASACSAVPAAAPTQAPPTPAATAASAATPTPAPTARPTAAPTSAEPLDALSQIFRGWLGVKSFRAKITTTTSTGAVTEMNLDAVMPDRFHAVSKQFEVIIIGATYYVKIGNQWQKIALPKGFDISSFDIKTLEAQLGASTEVKLIGPDVLDGAPMVVYQYTTTIKTPTPSTLTSKVWIAVADQLPRKMESTPKTGGKTVIVYSDYNANITIDPPIK